MAAPGANADAAAAEKAARDGSDPDLARLDARWERGGLDPIEMAMLDAENVGVVGVPVSMMDAGEVDIQQLGNMMDGVPPPQVVETEYRGAKEGEYRWDAAADAYKYRDSDDEGEALDPAALLASGPSGDSPRRWSPTPRRPGDPGAAARRRPRGGGGDDAPDDCITPRGVRGREEAAGGGGRSGDRRGAGGGGFGFGRRRRGAERSPARSPAPAAASTPPRRRTWAPSKGAIAGAVRHDAVRFRRGVESRNDAWIDSSRRKQTTGGGFGRRTRRRANVRHNKNIRVTNKTSAPNRH